MAQETQTVIPSRAYCLPNGKLDRRRWLHLVGGGLPASSFRD